MENKANILVQYQGGGYDGCFWEWNFCLVDNPENPAQFENIQASGRSGIKTLEEYKKADLSHAYYYDLTCESKWEEFDKEANPAHVFGVSAWLEENRDDLCHTLHCDNCGGRIGLEYDEYPILAHGHGDGGIGIQYEKKLCEECDIQEEWEHFTRDQIIEDLADQNVSFDDLSTEDRDRVLWRGFYDSGAEWEGSGDDRRIYGYDEMIAYIVEHKDTIRHDVLCQDDQMMIDC